MPGLAQLCTRSHYIRSNYYSDTYRAEVEIDGETALRDIVHISIPFSEEKENEFRKRHNLTDDELDRYYTVFASNLKNAWQTEDCIRSSAGERAKAFSLCREKLTVIKKEDGRGSDIFIVYPVAKTLSEEGILTEKGAERADILRLGFDLLKMSRAYEDIGVSAGFYDPDSLYIAENADGKKQLKYGFFLFSGHADGHGTVTCDVENMVQPLYCDGAKPDSGTDVYAVCSLLWTLLSGQHYTTPPDFTSDPKYAPDGFPEALKGAAISAQQGKDELIYSLKTLLEGHLEPCFINMDPPLFGYPNYEPDEHIGDLIASSDRYGSPEPDDSGSEKTAENRRKNSRFLILVTSALLLIPILIFVTVPLLRGPKQPESKEPACSAEDGLFELNGDVVDEQGDLSEDYILDPSGNLIDEKGKVLYESAYVSKYPVITDFELKVLSKEFKTLPLLSDYPYRDGIVILDGSIPHEYNWQTGSLSVPESYASSSRFREGLILIIRADKSDIPVVIEKENGPDGEKAGYRIYNVSEDGIDEISLRQGSEEQLSLAQLNGEKADAYAEESLGGTWTVLCKVQTVLDDGADSGYTIDCTDFDTYEIKVNAEQIRTRTELSAQDDSILSVKSPVRIPCSITLTASLGGYSESFELAFPEGDRVKELPLDTRPVPTPTPTPFVPISTPAPTSAAAPEVRPTPVPGPTAGPQVYEAPAEPTTFTLSATSLTLHPGQMARIETSGDDGGFIQVYSSDPDIATVDIYSGTDGAYTVYAAGNGTCTLTFKTNTATVTVAVSVT